MRLIVSKVRLFHFVLLIIFYLIFEFRYYSFIFVKYEHSRFLFDYSLSKYIIGKVLLLISLYKANNTKSKFVYTSIILFILFVLIPNLILFQFNYSPIIISLLIVLFLQFLSINILSHPPVKIFNIKKSQILPVFFITTLILIIPFFFIYGFKINLKIFEFGPAIYEVRRSVKELSTFYSAYMYFPLKNFLIPVLVTYAFIEKKRVFVILGLIMVLYLFMIIPHKSTFFSIFVIIVFYFYNNYYKKLNLILLGLLGVIVLSIISTEILNSNLLESIFFRRMFFIPAQLNTAYFEIFKDNPIYLSHSIFSFFIDYPYKLEPAFYVADQYFKEPKMSANNGFISDGFMNFGLIGSVGFALIVSVIFNFFDSLKISSRFYGVFFLFIKLTMGSALLTMFFTHGLFIFLIISIVFLKNTAINNET